MRMHFGSLARRWPLALGALLPVSAAHAIDIQLVFEAGLTEQHFQGGVNRTLDLIPLVEAAAAHYEDIFEDNQTIVIRYWWAAVGDPEACIEAVDAQGQPTQARMQFVPNFNYFMDPSPLADAEFDMLPKLYRDTLPVEQADAFFGNVPEVFEMGYNGVGPGNDLLTIIMHEMGHAVGLVNNDASPPCGAPNTECNSSGDQDYDIPAAWVGGNVMAIRGYHEPDGDFDCAHLAAGGIQACNDDPNCESWQSLMWTGFLPGRRSRPSINDIFAIADRSGYTQVDLPRKFWLGTINNWHTTCRWIGNRVPDSQDDVYLIIQDQASGASVSTSNAVARNILVGENNFLGVFNTRSLTVGNTIEIEGGQLRVDAATSFVQADKINLDSISELIGAGNVEVDTLFTNQGEIRATNNGTLTLFTSSFFPVFDMDGNPDAAFARLEAVDGNLVIFGQFLDQSFDGVVEVGSGRSLSFADELRFNSTIELNGTPSTATLSGPKVLDGGTLEVDGTGNLTGLTTIDGAWVQVPNVDDELIFTGNTVLVGGLLTGAGVATQTGNLIVNSGFTIGVDTYDWDGADDDSVTTINPLTKLTIDSNKIEDSPFVDGMDGTINMNLAELEVNASGAWRLDGELRVNLQDGFFSIIGGSNLDLQGLLHAADLLAINARLDILSTGELRLDDAQTIVSLNGQPENTIAGGDITGVGTLEVPANRSLFGHGTVTPDINIAGEIRAEDGTLSLTGSIDAIGTVGTRDSTGVINITDAWTTGTGGVIDLRGGSLTGGPIQCNGSITGFGTINVPFVDFAGLISPSPNLNTGILVFINDLDMFNAAVTRIDLGGPISGAGSDLIRVFGAADIDGRLELVKSPLFNPSCGVSQLIVSGSPLTGQFDQVTGKLLPNGLMLRVVYTATTVSVRAVPTGDLNGDLTVNDADLGLLLNNYGCTGLPGVCIGDINEDGVTNDSDLGLLLNNFGISCPS